MPFAVAAAVLPAATAAVFVPAVAASLFVAAEALVRVLTWPDDVPGDVAAAGADLALVPTLG